MLIYNAIPPPGLKMKGYQKFVNKNRVFNIECDSDFQLPIG
jgi:hypothetical protein